MGEMVLLVLVLLLALYGFATFVSDVAVWLCKPARRPREIRVVPISGHREDVEWLVRSLTKQCRDGGLCTSVLLLDAGMDQQTRRIAEHACAQSGCVGLYDCDKVSDVLTQCRAEKI